MSALNIQAQGLPPLGFFCALDHRAARDKKRPLGWLSMTTSARPATKVSSAVRAACQTQTRCFPCRNTAQLNITDIIGRWWCGLGIASTSQFSPRCDQICERHGASRMFFTRPPAFAELAASAVPLTDWAITPGGKVRLLRPTILVVDGRPLNQPDKTFDRRFRLEPGSRQPTISAH